MFIYEKKLQFPVKISTPNPKLAAVIISQYGGPDGELGASMRYLSQRYSMPYAEAKGLLTRKVYAEVPPRVEYTLTKTGYSLKPILDSMVVWGTHYKEKAAAMEDDDAPDEA